MIKLATYSDERMDISSENLVRSAYPYGVESCSIWSPKALSEIFIEMAEPTISEPKGAGLYIWKPYIVWQEMNHLSDNDILIYADAGQTIISSVQPVIDAMDSDVFLFSNGWNHLDWCKMDVMQAILPIDVREEQTNCGTFVTTSFQRTQAQASLMFFRVSAESRKFVKEWMLWCLMPGFCDNSPSTQPNVSTFQETRWDQSILTALAYRDGYHLHWFPSSTNWHNKSAHPNDNYPAIVDHHRKRNPGATGGTDSEW